jgi:hypothetical protein
MSGILGGRKGKPTVAAAPAAKGERQPSISPEFQAFLDGQRAAKAAGETLERPKTDRRPSLREGLAGHKGREDSPPGVGQ